MRLCYLPATVRAVFAWLVLCLSPAAQAADVTIGARYRADVGNQYVRFGSSNEWICSTWPALCKNAAENAVDLPFGTYYKTTFKDKTAREQYYVRVPPPRALQVRREGGNEVLDLMFEVTHVSQYAIVTAESPARNNSPIATGRVGGTCTVVRAPSQPEGSGGTFQWQFWGGRDNKNCWSSSELGSFGDMRVSLVSRTGIGYKLSLPSPTKIVSGIYRGSLVFTVGDVNSDFDFGEGTRGLASSLTIDFELDLRHELKVDFPPGSDRAVLEPPGGWLAWPGGRVPPQLARDLPFRLTASGPFTVHAACEYPLEGSGFCRIFNENGDQAVVDLAMSLPAGVKYNNGPVQRLRIPANAARPMRLIPDVATSALPGTVHFSVRESWVKSMLQQPGSTYRGGITLLFDAEVL
ncbi:hypothetical protein QEM13_002287 [Pseudomonas putida]|nr:hypothetical protein [Pseudomonas putida]